MLILQVSLLSKPCFEKCGAYDKAKFIDHGSFGEIVSPETPGFFDRRKLKKLRRIYDVINPDDKRIDSKALFRRDFVFAIECYGKMYGIDFSDKDIAVSGDVGNDNIACLSEMFRMVWIKSVSFYDSLFNTYYVREKLPPAYVFVSIDGLVGYGDIVFNLSDREIPGINNIEVSSPGLSDTGSVAREIIRRCNLPYEIKDFIKS